jgi:hypothetical protein
MHQWFSHVISHYYAHTRTGKNPPVFYRTQENQSKFVPSGQSVAGTRTKQRYKRAACTLSAHTLAYLLLVRRFLVDEADVCVHNLKMKSNNIEGVREIKQNKTDLHR